MNLVSPESSAQLEAPAQGIMHVPTSYGKSEIRFSRKVWSKEELPSVEEDLLMELTKYGLEEQALWWLKMDRTDKLRGL